MTTPLIPTKAALNSIRYTPAELIADQSLEEYLLDLPNRAGFLFIQALMNAYRTGETYVDYSFSSYEIADTMAGLIGVGTAYNYTVTGPEVSPEPTTSIRVSWA